mmetsp:Transcript_70079/g.137773  ORF Transcript_70079/g.137773 Transcript_70079/m.137773 type:complete len:385 (-) Transcript_70079:187-1341(-)
MVEQTDAQLLVTKAMQEDEENSSDEDGGIGERFELGALRHLSVLDPTPLDEAGVMAEGKLSFERYIHRAATEATEKLVSALWALPTEQTPFGRVATLPPQRGLSVMPREKPLPEPPKETRWEKFAREKGIEKKKRGRMVWDDQEQKWAPRYGFNRAYGEGEVPIMEVKTGQDPFEDPWEREKNEKKARVSKNVGQQLKNDERTGRRVASIKATMPVDLPEGRGAFAASFNGQNKSGGANAEGASKPSQRGKEGVSKTLTLVQNSTASMGAFDVRRQGEPGQRLAAGSRKEKVANDLTKSGMASEKARNDKMLGRVLNAVDKPAQPKFKGSRGERIEARKRSREFHPLDDAPFQNLGGGDAGEYKKKKGRAAAGKMTKMTKKRIK